ncbi:hypothetical protein [Phenylobacterium sp. NIBR 498073]|uniref:hypothetical protein n=1 Tax=Phenylobacterium sp. NIBR 498073 TaxID=3015177 RepID=UPI0022B3D835|nr:hypothetical protein [Phenylobacterium sp. NIBR 498073]WGU38431.1 hypothetical protein O4N75_12260 [Phenylobacterium sp. NIBR 498073]
MGNVIAVTLASAIVGGYFTIGFALFSYAAVSAPKSENVKAWPHPLAFMGPWIWSYVFSGRHLGANDPVLSGLVRSWRVTMILLPIGFWALFAI